MPRPCSGPWPRPKAAAVESFQSAAAPVDLELVGEENDVATRFAAGRLRDFAHGRYCARQALARLGIERAAIGMGESREPLWPDGIVGSITHSADLAAAAVCRDDAFTGLGIDCEDVGRINDAMLKRICLDTELAALAEAGYETRHADALFSAKESVYKCIWPVVRRYVGFHEVAVSLERESRRFSVAAASDKVDANLLSGIEGRWCMDDDRVYTIAWRRAGD